MDSALPTEVVERIIDCLALDQRSMRACALVSREWYPRSIHHLYGILSPWSAKQLDALLRVRALPCVASALKEVHTLELWPGIVRGGSNAKNIFPLPWYYRVPLVLGRACPNVAVLSLRNLDFKRASVHADPLVIGFPHFTKLRKLVLQTVSFRNEKQMRTFVRAFPVLESLLVSGTSYQTTPELEDEEDRARPARTSSAAVSRPALKYLRTNERHLWKWLAKTPTAQSLRSLHIAISSRGGVEALSEGDARPIVDLNLDLHTALQVITIETSMGTGCCFIDVLRRVSPLCKIRELHLGGHRIHREPWAALYDVLQTKQFSRLGKITFQFRSWKPEINDVGADEMTLTDVRRALYARGVQVYT